MSNNSGSMVVDKLCNGGEYPCNGGEYPCNKCNNPCEFPCSKNEYPYTKSDYSCNKDVSRCNKGDYSCNKGDYSCNKDVSRCNIRTPFPASEYKFILQLFESDNGSNRVTLMLHIPTLRLRVVKWLQLHRRQVDELLKLKDLYPTSCVSAKKDLSTCISSEKTLHQVVLELVLSYHLSARTNYNEFINNEHTCPHIIKCFGIFHDSTGVVETDRKMDTHIPEAVLKALIDEHKRSRGPKCWLYSQKKTHTHTHTLKMTAHIEIKDTHTYKKECDKKK
eukprot:GHVR01053821.1.p1 GENE.GHVR01053821.1~~GHVR01053821.1.p1  ORF type:complete len:277 (+),score=78.09 GHVR01053821.1:36-866(+)